MATLMDPVMFEREEPNTKRRQQSSTQRFLMTIRLSHHPGTPLLEIEEEGR